MEAKLNFQTKTFAGWSQVIIHQHTATNGLIKIISWFLCLENLRFVGVGSYYFRGYPTRLLLGNKGGSGSPPSVRISRLCLWLRVRRLGSRDWDDIDTETVANTSHPTYVCVCGQQVNDMQTLLDTGINQIFCVASVSWTKNRLIALTPPEKCLIILLFKIIDHHEEQLSWWASQCFDETTHAQGLTDWLTAPPSQCRLERVVVPETGCKLPDCLSMTRG